jgi:hypothetical protein
MGTLLALGAFLGAHGTEILAALFAIHAAALAIVNLTPTPKDDAVVAKFYRVLEVVAGLVTKLSKG